MNKNELAMYQMTSDLRVILADPKQLEILNEMLEVVIKLFTVNAQGKLTFALIQVDTVENMAKIVANEINEDGFF